MSGPILETWAISELLRSYLHNGKQPPFYYYRDKDKKEIDLVIIRDGTIYLPAGNQENSLAHDCGRSRFRRH